MGAGIQGHRGVAHDGVCLGEIDDDIRPGLGKHGLQIGADLEAAGVEPLDLETPDIDRPDQL